MITETRMISFSPAALAEAIRLFGQANRDRHFTLVREVTVRQGKPPVVTAEVSGDDSAATDSLEFTSAETAAFLILLCRRQRIPLPHHANKSLHLIGDELCLVVSGRSHPIAEALGAEGEAESEIEPASDFVSPDGA